MKKGTNLLKNIYNNFNEYNEPNNDNLNYTQYNNNNIHRINTENNIIKKDKSQKSFKKICLFHLKEENEKLKDIIKIILKTKSIKTDVNVIYLIYKNHKLTKKCLELENKLINLNEELKEYQEKCKIYEEKLKVKEQFKYENFDNLKIELIKKNREN